MKKITFLSAFLVILLSFLIIDLTSGTKGGLVSPLLKNEKVLSVNQWFPRQVLGIQTNAPQISAKSALFIESRGGQILFEKNAKEKLPVASLVKVMTALIALEHKKLDDQFVVSQAAAEMEPDKMILIAGERLTLKELLYGIFLISANDAAEVLAEQTTENREEFVELMNSKAKQLGMKDTYFKNPTGLDEDSNNSYSTAYDLAILTRYLIRTYPEVVEISANPHIYLPQSQDHQDYDMYSGINLLSTYDGVVGFKTGYTPAAGLTLITLARKDGYEVIGVLLGSESRRDEAKLLLDYSFGKVDY
ncbi:D-alanyl-D-alanine carboxypeptidase [Candidatus Microgenomates bacterium]|nr:D-alanyl-D-alanine carboxypeptidase [Candidatus Microgenomates bacterium]